MMYKKCINKYGRVFHGGVFLGGNSPRGSSTKENFARESFTRVIFRGGVLLVPCAHLFFSSYFLEFLFVINFASIGFSCASSTFYFQLFFFSFLFSLPDLYVRPWSLSRLVPSLFFIFEIISITISAST